MKQPKLTSLFKSLFSTAVGFAVAFFANMLILPLFGLPISHSANLLLTTIYTVISIARGFALERVFEAFGWRQRISPFMSAVIAERQRQITHEGYDHAHDDAHSPRDLAHAGAAYLIADERFSIFERDDGVGVGFEMSGRKLWPWVDGYKPDHGQRRNYVKGAALAVAAGEHVDRNRKSRRVAFPFTSPSDSGGKG